MKSSSKKVKTIVLIAVAVAAVCALAVALIFTVIIPTVKYDGAVRLYEAGEYEEAAAAFDKLNGFRDSREQAERCRAALSGENVDAAVPGDNGGAADAAGDPDGAGGAEQIGYGEEANGGADNGEADNGEAAEVAGDPDGAGGGAEQTGWEKDTSVGRDAWSAYQEVIANHENYDYQTFAAPLTGNYMYALVNMGASNSVPALLLAAETALAKYILVFQYDPATGTVIMDNYPLHDGVVGTSYTHIQASPDGVGINELGEGRFNPDKSVCRVTFENGALVREELWSGSRDAGDMAPEELEGVDIEWTPIT